MQARREDRVSLRIRMSLLETYLNGYGYPLLFVVIFVESFGVPAPGQTLLITAAVLAGHGKLNIALVCLTAFLAAVIGDSIGYWIGLKGGHRLILRFGKYFGVGAPQINRIETAFARFGGWFVTFARFFEVLRQVNGIVAGTAEMPFKRFLLFNATGAVLWVAVWGLGPWRLGKHVQRIAQYYDEASTIFIVVLIIVLVGLLLWVISHHLRARRPLAEQQKPRD